MFKNITELRPIIKINIFQYKILHMLLQFFVLPEKEKA